MPWFFLTNRDLLKQILRNQGDIMASQQEILANLAAANASLDGITADIAALDELIQQGTDLTAIQAASAALAAKAAAIDATHP